MKACCPKIGCKYYAQGWGHQMCLRCRHRVGGPHTPDEHEDNHEPRRSR